VKLPDDITTPKLLIKVSDTSKN